MKIRRKYLILSFILLLFVSKSQTSHAQVFYIGVEGGGVYSWFSSPDLENVITSDGWGAEFGFFIRYGKRPFIKAGFDWTRSENDVIITYYDENIGGETQYRENIKLNNFDFSLKIGYELLQTPMFKISIHGGPFLGKSLMFSGENLDFDNEDFKNPQFGINGGMGFQFTNLIFGLEYNYHFTDLFVPLNIDGREYKLGSKLQMIFLRVGLMF